MKKDIDDTPRVVIFGGTGKTGVQLVHQALERQYSVRVLARSPEKAERLPSSVDVHLGDGTDPEAVSKAVAGMDVVLCAVGGQGLRDSSTRTVVTKNILSAMKAHGVQKIIVCSVVGIGKSAAHLSPISRFFTKIILRHAMNDHHSQEQAITESGVDYVIFRPPQLRDGKRTETVELADETEAFRAAVVNRADVAHAMLNAIHDDTLHNCKPTIASS